MSGTPRPFARFGVLMPALAVAAAALSAQQAPPPGTPAEPPRSAEQVAAIRASMNGVWDYNDDYSVDAATGRQEQAPLSATQRGRGGNQAGRTGGGGGDDFERRALAMMVAERRALVRDLLEVPERLSIRATATELTFTDDLDRARVYPADGKLRKYQIGAAQFEARGSWDGVQFQKEIHGPNNFRMTETFFLTNTLNRLIVIVRIGDPKKPEQQFGVNRVYDRLK